MFGWAGKGEQPFSAFRGAGSRGGCGACVSPAQDEVQRIGMRNRLSYLRALRPLRLPSPETGGVRGTPGEFRLPRRSGVVCKDTEPIVLLTSGDVSPGLFPIAPALRDAPAALLRVRRGRNRLDRRPARGVHRLRRAVPWAPSFEAPTAASNQRGSAARRPQIPLLAWTLGLRPGRNHAPSASERSGNVTLRPSGHRTLARDLDGPDRPLREKEWEIGSR